MSAPRATAADRVRRLLTIVPWIASHDGPTVADVCRRFGVSRSELVNDLQVVFLIGVHPFTPDTLIDVVLDDDRVWIDYAPVFDRPLRLTPEQALALLAAGRSLLDTPGVEDDGPLARALSKVADVAGIDPDRTLRVNLGEAQGSTLALLRTATDERRAVELDYYSHGRDERTHRLVEPHRVFAHDGNWYLSGHCRSAGGDRVFRVDRIEEAVLTDEPFEPPAEPAETGIYHARADDPRITLELSGPDHWVISTYPTEAVTVRDDGRAEVRLAVSGRPWLERLLLRLGPSARVIAADAPLGDDVGAAAARRVLERYTDDDRAPDIDGSGAEHRRDGADEA
ncbi:MAG: WYL domain-containing protein [Actinomycetota bacterium]|nr:WYL domain-containing protein [Actinomycetota bacterium]